MNTTVGSITMTYKPGCITVCPVGLPLYPIDLPSCLLRSMFITADYCITYLSCPTPGSVMNLSSKVQKPRGN